WGSSRAVHAAGVQVARGGGRDSPLLLGGHHASVRASREGLASFVDRIVRRTVIGVCASG
ncbi:MAG TPA: hypothetical protein PK377_06700, partial [Methanothrix sp.]|nr:hypothetical protein [Methanothrix sp.]